MVSWCALRFREPCFVIGKPPATHLWIRSLTFFEFSVTKNVIEFFMEYSCQSIFMVLYICICSCYKMPCIRTSSFTIIFHDPHDAWRESLWANWDLGMRGAMAMPYRMVSWCAHMDGRWHFSNLFNFSLSPLCPLQEPDLATFIVSTHAVPSHNIGNFFCITFLPTMFREDFSLQGLFLLDYMGMCDMCIFCGIPFLVVWWWLCSMLDHVASASFTWNCCTRALTL